MWERVGAASGIAFVAFLLASFFVIPDAPPALDDPVGEIRSFYVDNSSAFQASAYLTGVAGFFFLCFLGSLGAALAGRPIREEWLRSRRVSGGRDRARARVRERRRGGCARDAHPRRRPIRP